MMDLLERPARIISREFHVLGCSMEPNFVAGSLVRMSPLTYFYRSPRRGDVVGLRSPEDKERYELKRIIGLPGEAISWKGDRIWINGFLFPEPYARQASPNPQEPAHRLELGPGE